MIVLPWFFMISHSGQVPIFGSFYTEHLLGQERVKGNVHQRGCSLRIRNLRAPPVASRAFAAPVAPPWTDWTPPPAPRRWACRRRLIHLHIGEINRRVGRPYVHSNCKSATRNDVSQYILTINKLWLQQGGKFSQWQADHELFGWAT